MTVSRETKGGAPAELLWSGDSYELAEREAIRGEAAPHLDTKGLTVQQVEQRRHNPTAERPKLIGSRGRRRNDRAFAPDREFWLQSVGELTALTREHKARALEERGAEHAKENRQEWKASGLVARTPTGGIADNLPAVSRWHAVRAEGKRRLFNRVDACTDSKRRVEITCRGCGRATAIRIGCNSQMFCPDCRGDGARKMRIAFTRKRLGMVNLAKKSGNLARKRTVYRNGKWVTHYQVKNKHARAKALGVKYGGFAERFATFTVPHVGKTHERIEVLRETWARAWRTFADEQRKKLRKLPAQIKLEDSDRGFRAVYNRATGMHECPSELSLWDLVSYLWVLEWTEGDDRLGHPHLHCWLFTPWFDWQKMREHWSLAWAHVMRKRQRARIAQAEEDGNELEVRRLRAEQYLGVPLHKLGRDFVPLLRPDVRAIAEGEDPADEIVKYLTKDWSDDDTRRVDPEVFAEVYATLDGKRRRQTNAGLSHWQIEKYKACPCCGYERERGHWAFVSIVTPASELGGRKNPDLPPPPEPARVEPKPSTRADELRREWEERRQREWLESFEYADLQARLRTILPG